MDYKEKANEVILAACSDNDWIKCQGILAHCAHRDSIEAALRQCAAEEARRMVQCAVDAVAQGAKMAEVIAVLHLEAAALDKSEGGV